MSTANNFNDRNYVITCELFCHAATAIASNDYPVFDASELRSSVASLSAGDRWAGGRGGGSQTYSAAGSFETLLRLLLTLYGATNNCGDGQIPNKMSAVDLWRNF